MKYIALLFCLFLGCNRDSPLHISWVFRPDETYVPAERIEEPAPEPPPVPTSVSYEFFYSYNADGSNPQKLEGATITANTNVYFILQPTPYIDEGSFFVELGGHFGSYFDLPFIVGGQMTTTGDKIIKAYLNYDWAGNWDAIYQATFVVQ